MQTVKNLYAQRSLFVSTNNVTHFLYRK